LLTANPACFQKPAHQDKIKKTRRMHTIMPGLAQAFGQNPSVKKDLMLLESIRDLKKSGVDKKRSHENYAASQRKVGQG
jgi:hypothetical protein